MIRWLIRLAYSAGDVVNHASSVRQVCVNDASIVRQLSDEKLHETVGTEVALKTEEKEEEKRREDGPEQAITGLLQSLNWYGAKLANGTTPAEFATNLLEASTRPAHG
jgi:hypothetical protein